MEYENPPIPEGINVSSRHPLKDFFSLAALVTGIAVALLLALSLVAGELSVHIPFETERQLAERYLPSPSTARTPQYDQQIETWLQQLGERLATVQGLPEAFSLRFHYDEADIVNAYATLGGHITVYCGLLRRMPDENALAMVLAHEIAHIKHRDPIVALGRGVTVALALASLSGLSDSFDLGGLVGQAGNLTTLSFSRNMEAAADREALHTLLRYYGHTHNAEYFFKQMADEQHTRVPVFLSTHPSDRQRIERIQTFTNTQPQITTRFRPLPEWMPKRCH